MAQSKLLIKNWFKSLGPFVIYKGTPHNYKTLEIIGEGGQAYVLKVQKIVKKKGNLPPKGRPPK